MPILDLDEIPRCAGQYFRSVGVNGNIIFNSNPPDACRIYAGFNCDYVSRFQALLLPPRHPGILVHFESKPMARAVNKEMVEMIPGQDLPRRRIDIPAGYAACCCRDRSPLSLQYRLVPHPDAFWGPPHVHCPSNVAAIVAEYNTQVQHDQLIFPQSFGRGPRMRQGGSLSEGNDRFKCRSRRASLSQQTDRQLHDLTRQDGRPSHLGEFRRVLAHPEALDIAQSRNPAHLRTRAFAKTLQLAHRNLRRVKSHPAVSRILQELSDGFRQRAFLLEDADSGRFCPALNGESSIGDEGSALLRHHQGAGLPGEAGQIKPVRRAGYQQRIDFPVSKSGRQDVSSAMQGCFHKWNEETKVSSLPA